MAEQLNGRIFIIDGFDLGIAERTGTYVIDEKELTLVDTGASPSVPHIKKGLSELGFSLEQVKYIIVTHIHLDHAGGTGLLLQECPNAKVVVHPKGARHLADPSRLIAGAKAIYGDKFADLFDPIVPIPSERIIVKGEGDTLEVGPECTLEFWDTPGHAKHHFGIYDPVSNGMFAGDTVGIRYPQLIEEGIPFFLPSTSPNQFDPQAMQQAIDRFQAANFDAIFYGHYSMEKEPEEALRQVAEWLVIFVEEAEEAFQKSQGPSELALRLQEQVRSYLRTKGVPDNHEVYSIIKLDTEVSAMGLLDYLAAR